MAEYMQHVGTRLQHLMDLQLVWSNCYSVLTTRGWHSLLEKERALELEIALEILNKHIEYEFTGVEYARVINSLPKNAKEIPEDNNNATEPST